jgi:subtilisin family serine protease
MLKPTLLVSKRTLSFLTLALCAIGVTACDYVDDQTIIRPSDFATANPAPKKRDFAGNNRRHKVLLGLIDTGVDYNHPILSGNMHFTLDRTGKPIGYGHDYVGNDEWASPYLIRTSTEYELPANVDLDPNEIDLTLVKALDTKYIYISSWLTAAYEKLQALHPALKQYLDPRRNLEQERAQAAHGTLVAGLMTYDRPDFGLLSYRVSPVGNEKHTAGDSSKRRQALAKHWVEQALIPAIDRAASDGARIVNLTLDGSTFDLDKTEPIPAQLSLAEEVRQAMLRHPQVLFITAAGDESAWFDNDVRVNYPCGLDVPNQICVGALQEDGKIASSSNIPLQNVDLVFALGAEVTSTYPTLMCSYNGADSLFRYSLADSDYNHSPGWTPSQDKKITLDDYALSMITTRVSEDISNNCSKMTGFAKSSGTSMATPFVAHVAGEILADHPDLSVPELMREIGKRTVNAQVGIFPIQALKTAMPSWYSKASEGLDQPSSMSGQIRIGMIKTQRFLKKLSLRGE